jgi:hypothetical protein
MAIKHLHFSDHSEYEMNQIFTHVDFTIVSFKHILINITNFTGTPNSTGILYNTSLFT